MITCQGRNNQTTVPVLDHHGNPLAPARPSRIRRWLESGRGQKVWIKGIFAVQFTDVDAVHAITGDLALNMDPGETTGIAITRDSHDDAQRTIVGAYGYQHHNRDIHRNLESRREKRRNRRGRLRRLPARFNNRANNRSEGWLPPSVRGLVEDMQTIVQTMLRLYPISIIRVEYLRFDTQLIQNLDVRGADYQRGTLWGWQLREYILQRDHRVCQYCNKPGTKGRPLTLDHVIPVLHQDRADEPPRHVCCGVVRVDLDDGAEVPGRPLVPGQVHESEPGGDGAASGRALPPVCAILLTESSPVPDAAAQTTAES